MAEVLQEYDHILIAPNGKEYRARSVGRANRTGLWEGWIELIPLDGGAVLRTTRETTQPNRTDLEYWATGLSGVYLEGAFARTPEFGPPPRIFIELERPAFEAPAPSSEAPLNPFAAYSKGEDLLRMQLIAMEDWQLRRIIDAYGIADSTSGAYAVMTANELVAVIMEAAREHASEVGLR